MSARRAGASFLAGLLVGGLVLGARDGCRAHNAELEALRLTNETARTEAAAFDSSRAESHRAADAARAEENAAVLAHHTRAVELGTMAGRALDGARFLAAALKATADSTKAADLAQALDSATAALAAHLAADSALAVKVADRARADSIERAAERVRADSLAAARNAAMARAERIAQLARPQDWSIGVHVGYGVTIANREVHAGPQAGISVQRRVRF